MNPQYLSQQQYGAPPHGFPNINQNNQGFQSVPLAPPKSGIPLNAVPSSVSSPNQGPQLGNLLGKMPSGNLSTFSLLPPEQKSSPNSIEQKQNSNNNMDGASQEPLLDLGSRDNTTYAPPRSLQSQQQNGPSQNGNGGFNIPLSQLPPSNIHSRPPVQPLNQLSHGMPPMPHNRSSPSSQIPTRPSPSFTPSSQTGQIGPPPTTQSVPSLLRNEPASGQVAASIGPVGDQLLTNQYGEQTRILNQHNSGPQDIQKNPLGPPPSQGMEQNPLGPPLMGVQQNPFGSTIQNTQHNPLGLSHGIQPNSLGPVMQQKPLIPPTQNNQHIPLGLSSQASRQNNLNSPPQGSPQNPLGSAPPISQGIQEGQTKFSEQSQIPPMGQQQFDGGYFPAGIPGQNMAARNPMQSGAIPPQRIPPPNVAGVQNQPGLPGQFSMPGQPSVANQFPFGHQPARGPPQVFNQSSITQHQYRQPPVPSSQMPLSGQPPLPGRPLQQSFGQPPLPGQPPLSGPPPISGPPLLSGPPLGPQPPMQIGGPGQMQPNSHYNQNSLPPSQYSNQITNQMQNMNLGGPKQFSEVPQKGPMNGEMLPPHMPPPLSGQQMQGPGGLPPMSGQQQQMPPAPGGYPPQPGYPQQQPGYPHHLSYQQQQAQQRRLDPDQMPSPIQVMGDDQANRSGVFVTNQKGLTPPLVTTNFVVQDQGNTSPRFLRSTMYNVPVSTDLMKTTAIPFSLVISPMARLEEGEYPPPIVNFGELGPVRCIRCKAYMCPFMNFVDSGRRFQCAFCKATTDVPAEYFQHLDHTGQRMDRFERPELVLGTYEFIATADYCRNNVLPKPPAIIFVIDVSYNSVKSGLIHLLCSQMKEIIQNLPVDQSMEKSNMKIGFITYNSSVHFYNIKGTLAAPQMLVVGDTHEMFMPLLDGFLSTPEESEVVIDSLMEQIPVMFAGTRETETVLLPAILAGIEALKASECAGKLLVFTSNLPSAEAPGKLKNRDDRKLLGTEKERTILTPQNQAYNQLGQDCVQVGCSVDLFIFNNSYIDIATIGQVSRLSGGEIFKYTYFQADIDGERLIGDIILDISRPIAFDAIMRVRTSTGVRPTDFYGHFFMSNTTDMELASIDCDKAVALEIKHDDKLQEDDGVFIQSALLYTSCSGQRRLRVSNLSLRTCSQMADLYRSCDLDTLVNYICKQSIFKLMDNNPKVIKDAILNRAAHILATYRKNCASPSSAGQLILPECMKLLPLYTNCLLKSDALSGGSDMTVDDRSFVMQAVMTMDIPTSVHFFYPRLIPIHDIEPEKEVAVPSPIRCTIEKMTEEGVYILENGIHMFLWIGLAANPDFIQKVFGVQSAVQVNIEQTRLPILDNPLSIAVRNIIEEIRIQKHRYMRLTMVRQREKMESVFKHFLVEDRGVDGSPSYVDFLCHMHKEIRTILS